MNFEIKSTFNKINKSVNLLRHSGWMLLVNTSTSSIIGWLYLTNRSIPATIISRPGGNLFFVVVCAAITIKMVGSLYAATILLMRNHMTIRDTMMRIGRTTTDFLTGNGRQCDSSESDITDLSPKRCGSIHN